MEAVKETTGQGGWLTTPAWALRFFSRAFSRWLPRAMVGLTIDFCAGGVVYVCRLYAVAGE